jgi:hypothetical protein
VFCSLALIFISVSIGRLHMNETERLSVGTLCLNAALYLGLHQPYSLGSYKLHGFAVEGSPETLVTIGIFVLGIKELCAVFHYSTGDFGRSERPRGLRHELSSPAQSLGSWYRITLEARMSVRVYSVFVLSGVQVEALRRAELPFKESYRLCKRSRNLKIGQGPTKSYRAINR